MPESAKELRAAEIDDATLVERVRRGDAAAFRTLYWRYARYLAGVLYRMLGSDAELDDIIQDTFVTANEKIDTLSEPEHLRRWLVKIAVRRAGRVMSKRRRRGGILSDLGRNAPASSDPKDREPADQLFEALVRLPEKLRIPWSLHHVEGQRLEDVAAITEVSVATVKRRIAEGQRRIERRLGA